MEHEDRCNADSLGFVVGEESRSALGRELDDRRFSSLAFCASSLLSLPAAFPAAGSSLVFSLLSYILRITEVGVKEGESMLVMEAEGAGEEEFPRCTGAGDLVTRCCLFLNPSLVLSTCGLPRPG